MIQLFDTGEPMLSVQLWIDTFTVGSRSTRATSAFFQSDGTTPSLSDCWKMADKIVAISNDSSFKKTTRYGIRPIRWPRPHLLFTALRSSELVLKPLDNLIQLNDVLSKLSSSFCQVTPLWVHMYQQRTSHHEQCDHTKSQLSQYIHFHFYFVDNTVLLPVFV